MLATATMRVVPDPSGLASARNSAELGRLEGTHVLVVEADSRHALALRSALAREGARVTVACTPHDAHRRIRSRRPFDAAVVAARLQGVDGLPLLEALRRHERPCLAVVRSDRHSRASAHAIIAAGAIEPLFQTTHHELVVGAVERAVAATRTVRAHVDGMADPSRGARELDISAVMAPRARPSAPSTWPVLDAAIRALAAHAKFTPRECMVLRYIASGHRYRDIAVALGISVRTIKMHAGNMRNKLGVDSRHELVQILFGGVPCR